MLAFTTYIEGVQRDFGTSKMIEHILRMYEQTPAAFRKPTFDCIESTYAATARYSDEHGNEMEKLPSNIPTFHFISSTPALCSEDDIAAAREKLLTSIYAADYRVPSDFMKRFNINSTLGEFVKELCLFYEEHPEVSYQLTTDDVEFCKVHSSEPVISLLYLTGVLTSYGNFRAGHIMPTAIAAIGLRLIYLHNYAVLYHDADPPWKLSYVTNKEFFMVDRGKIVWDLY